MESEEPGGVLQTARSCSRWEPAVALSSRQPAVSATYADVRTPTLMYDAITLAHHPGPSVLIASSCAVDLAQQGGKDAVSTVAGIIDGFGSIGAGAAQFLVVLVQQTVSENRGKAASWNAVFTMLQAFTGAATFLMLIRMWRVRGQG